MNKPGEKTELARNLRELRELIDAPETDPVTRRIAYAMENAVTWATRRTRGWGGLAASARDIAEILRRDLGNAS